MMKRISKAIIDDHKDIGLCYQSYNSAVDTVDKTKWANELIWELARHSVAEEIVFYPAIEKQVPNGKEMAETARKEHQVIQEDLFKLDKLKAGHADFDTLLKKVMEELGTHVKQEEEVDIPKVVEAIPIEEQTRLGEEFERTKMFVPTRPHPSAPRKPPFETVAGLMSAPLDKLMDVFRSFPSSEELKKAQEINKAEE
jgi:hypothetical protein